MASRAQYQTLSSGRRLFQGVRDPRRRRPVGAPGAPRPNKAANPRRRGGHRRGRKRDARQGPGAKRPRSPEQPPQRAAKRGSGVPAAFARPAPAAAAAAEHAALEAEVGDTSDLAELGETVFTGTIKNISQVKGLGFIVCPESKQAYGRDIVVKPENLKHFSVGDHVNFCVFLEEGVPFGYALANHGAPPVGAPVDTSVTAPRTPERPPRRQMAKPSLAPGYSSPPQRAAAGKFARRQRQVQQPAMQVSSWEEDAGPEQEDRSASQGSVRQKAVPRYTPPKPKVQPMVPKPFTAFSAAAAKAEAPTAPSKEEPRRRSFQELFEKAKSEMKQLEAKRSGRDLRAPEACAPTSVKASVPSPAPGPTPKGQGHGQGQGRVVPPPTRGSAPKHLPKPRIPGSLEAPQMPEPEVDMQEEWQEWEEECHIPPDAELPEEEEAEVDFDEAPALPLPPRMPPPRLPQEPAGAAALSRSARAAAEAIPLVAGEEVLLLDILPSSALLVESLRESILARPGIRQLNFSQPPGQPTVPWRAEVIGSQGAVEEVEIFLENTLEHGSVILAGYEAGPGSSAKVTEGSCCVAVQGFQDAFGQGGSCAALMACGRVLQWTRAGNVAYCWLASAEAVWIAHQFLHRPPSLILPDEAAQRAVARWREGRRQEFAQLQGLWTLPEDEELDRLLMEDPTVKAAKARLAEFFRLLAEDDGYDVDGPKETGSKARVALGLSSTGQPAQGYASWQQSA